MPSTKVRSRKHTPPVSGRKRAPRGPDEPHELNLTGLLERDVMAVDAEVDRFNAALTGGAKTSRNALIVAWIRERLAAEAAKRGAP